MSVAVKDKKSTTTVKKPKSVKEQAPVDLVTFSVYLRRKNAALQAKNPDAPIVYWEALKRAVEAGGIKVFEYGKNKFIDWEASKDYFFRGWSNPHRQKKQDKKK